MNLIFKFSDSSSTVSCLAGPPLLPGARPSPTLVPLYRAWLALLCCLEHGPARCHQLQGLGVGIVFSGLHSLCEWLWGVSWVNWGSLLGYYRSRVQLLLQSHDTSHVTQVRWYKSCYRWLCQVLLLICFGRMVGMTLTCMFTGLGNEKFVVPGATRLLFRKLHYEEFSQFCKINKLRTIQWTY